MYARLPDLRSPLAQPFAVPALALCLLAACSVAQAGAREEVEASMHKFLAAKSWHGTMQIQGKHPMTNELDFTAPDRFRIKMEKMGTQYIIGDTMVMTMNGKSMRVPMPKGSVAQYRDPMEWKKQRAEMTIEGLGSDSVDGKPARKYRMRNKQQGDTDMLIWIGGDGYPLQIRVDGKAKGQGSTTIIRYSRFNDPSIRVQAP